MTREGRDVEDLHTKNQPEENYSDDCLIVQLPHIEQDASWDCGLACIQMVLPEDLATKFKQNLSTICPEEYHNQSTWTIDLCYILKNEFSLKLKYHTKTIGVNPSFSEERFYDNYISKDEARVNQRFKDASSKGIDIEVNSLDLSDLILHLKHNGLAIALIDAHLLECTSCKSTMNHVGSFIRGMFKAKLPFSGHYIVICGFDIQKKLIYYKDPAVKSELCCLSYPAFERARQAHGTDDDIILIYR